MARAGDVGTEMRILGARVRELEELITQNQEGADIGREYVPSLERGLDVLGVDPRVELAQPTLPGTVVFDLAGLERRWRAFGKKAVLLKDALEQSDFMTVNASLVVDVAVSTHHRNGGAAGVLSAVPEEA